MPAISRTGSSDVFVNTRPAVRQGDINTVHVFPKGDKCPPHTGAVKSGSSSVFINGRGAGRVGDGLVQCTSIAQGSTNVFAG